MTALVSEILKNSIAEELEIKKGDIILSVNGEKMSDMIDYNFLHNINYLNLYH